MRIIPIIAAAIALPAPAVAQELKPVADMRLRYEYVDQDGVGHDANAVTLRGRAGAELTSGDWSLLAEGEGTAALVEQYDSGLNSKTQYPIVADPENIELNRLQLQYRGLEGGARHARAAAGQYRGPAVRRVGRLAAE